MRKNKYSFLQFLFCILFLCFVSCGCNNNSNKETTVSDALPKIESLDSLMPLSPRKEVIGESPFILDISNRNKGYITAIADSSSPKVNLQLTGPDQVTYSYFLESGETAVIPVTSGNGSYILMCYQNIQASQYAALYSETLQVELENEFLPFLYPNQYVNFTTDSNACELAASLLPADATDLEILDAIYEYVTTHISYDYEKADSIEAGYLPDIDETLSSGKGICFDYAALITAMLRSRFIPCKLQIGYSGAIKHAWVDVYIQSHGWINKAIVFDGDTWGRLDPTFDSSAQDKEFITSYIGDAQNYTVQFTR